ncbi:hypothetical protein Ahy_B04g069051 [Arachis hypogaea]|uniref:Uncharacterized protein n=1 Tax=Arachis hypogaea TaxID=3818 RepID=A0A444ZBG6_ARAHY|nr:hypothetical protein Ahy_B04g069051 [Arachis hypogaea]
MHGRMFKPTLHSLPTKRVKHFGTNPLLMCPSMKKETITTKKRWYKINKAITYFSSCCNQATRNIRSGMNLDDTKELAYKLYSRNYGIEICFDWNKNREDNYQHKVKCGLPYSPVRIKEKQEKSKEKKKSLIVKKLLFIEDIKNIRENELLNREKEREEERKNREKDYDNQGNRLKFKRRRKNKNYKLIDTSKQWR